jgi:hypothetical protein
MPGIGLSDSPACSTNVGPSSSYELKSTVTSITQIDSTTNPAQEFWIKFTLSNGEGEFWINKILSTTNAGGSNNVQQIFDFTEDKPLVGLQGYRAANRMTAFGPIQMDRTACKAEEAKTAEVKYDYEEWTE